MKTIDSLLERVERSRDNSDTAYFRDLLLLGELTFKLLVVEILTALGDDREQHRYDLEYHIVRADSLGIWNGYLAEALTGPANLHVIEAAQDSVQALTEKFGPGNGSWQRKAIDELSEACECIEPGMGNDLRRKGSMRDWCDMFVKLRNRTRGHGATSQEKESVAVPHLSASFSAVASGYPGFKRPWAYLNRNVSGKYNVSQIAGDPSVFAKFKTENSNTISNGVYIWFDEPRACELLLTDSGLMDFFLPNGQGSDKGYEVLSYLSDTRKVVSTEKYKLPAAARAQSETAALGILDVVGELFSNMPSRRTHYIPRIDLETELKERLLDDRYPVITLQGRGRTGKTSLALEVLHQIADLKEFEIVYWASARDIDLLTEGHKAVKAGVLTAQDVAQDFLAALQPRTSPKDAEEFLTSTLSGKGDLGPIIFVVDNFETIRGRAELHTWLSNVVRIPNKVLVTTRTRDFKADYPITVSGMLRSEFDELVDEVSSRLGVANLVDGGYRTRLFEEADGHPYITKVLLGELARTGQKTGLQAVVATREGLLDALFERSFETLTSAGQRVFLTLSQWKSEIYRLTLDAVLLREANERLDLPAALDELEQSSLIEITSPDDNPAHEYISMPLAARLFGQKKLVTSEHQFPVKADIGVLLDFGATQPSEAMKLGLGPRIARFASQIANRKGRGEEVEPLMKVLEVIATSYPPAWLKLADLQEDVFGDLPKTIKILRKYLEVCPDDPDAWSRISNLYHRTKDSLGEINARLQLCEPDGGYELISDTANRLNYMLSTKQLNIPADERQLIIDQVRQLMEKGISEADGDDYSRLAWLCHNGKDSPAAREWAERGLQLHPENRYLVNLKAELGSSH